METKFSLIFDLILESFGIDYIFWVFFILNFILSVAAYKLGFARKLSVLKSSFVYLILFVGTYITTVFSVLKLPIAESLIIICIVLGVYRFRLYRERSSA